MNMVCCGGGDKSKIMKSALERADNADVLLIPSACSTIDSYNRKVKACTSFFEKFGASIVTLHQFDTAPTSTEIDHKFGNASLIYTIGGNTPTLLDNINRYNLRHTLVESAYNKVLAGTSAGALLPFKVGQSCPVSNPEEVEWQYEYITGLGLIDASLAVHADQFDPTPQGTGSRDRFSHFVDDFPEVVDSGIALDNGAGIILDDEAGVVIRAYKKARAQLVTKVVDKLIVTQLEDGFKV